MKLASKIFTILGMFFNFGLSFLMSVSIYRSEVPCMWILISAYFISFLLSTVFGILIIDSLDAQNKKIGLGIFGIIFVNIFSGIFYLCWDGLN